MVVLPVFCPVAAMNIFRAIASPGFLVIAAVIRNGTALVDAYRPKTFFKSSVPLAAGLVLIFFSSSPSMWKRPSTDLLVT